MRKRPFTARPLLFLSMLGAVILSTGTALGAADTALWREFLESVAGARSPMLPDFSHAGFAHGEMPIPDIAGPVFRVSDHGAIPDDGKDDAAAIQKAVDACEAAGGGVVLFPKGEFIINDDYSSATRPRVRIRKGGVVLRGAGCGDNGTVLYSPKEMQPVDPKKMWTGRTPIVVRAKEACWGPRRSRVVAPAPLNGTMLKLEAPHRFKPGDRVCLEVTRSAGRSASFVAPRQWDAAWTAGIAIRELHEIASVDGATVHLKEPLMIPVDKGGDWALQEFRLISGVGVEDIRFRGAWKETFKHHRSWRDDSAWRGMTWSSVENSWLRRCVFQDMNWPLSFSDCRQLTVESVSFEGSRGHFGMQVNGTYGVLALAVRDMAGHHHGPSLQGGSCATVYHRCSWAGNGSFDSHANNPYATLHDCNEGGLDLSGVGGSRENCPHHLHSMVLWNLLVTAAPLRSVDFWSVGKKGYQRSFVQVIVAGLSGAAVSLVDSPVLRCESRGTPVAPRSLWLAQLEHRLGRIPEHFRRYQR